MSSIPRKITRSQLSEFLPDPRAIRAFEQTLKQMAELYPEQLSTLIADIEVNKIDSGDANAKADQCLAAINRIADAIELIATATTPIAVAVDDDLSPRINVGTVANQNADNVFISGGTVTANLSNNQTALLRSTVALANGAGAGVGTITNAPAAGNPTKWMAVDDNGTTRYVPSW